MPIHPCEKDGKKGFQWGNHGTCYTGKDGYEKAVKQMKAIFKSGYRGESMLKEILEKINLIDLDKGDDLMDIEIGYSVKIDGKTFKCIDDMGDNGSFMLKDQKGNIFVYNADIDEFEPYDY